MDHRVQSKRVLLVILLLMMMTIFMTQVAIEHKKYKKLEPGQNITGTTVVELTSRSKLQCSDRLVEHTSRSKLQ